MIPDSLSPIANHLWQSTLFASAAGLVTLALRNNSARVRHWVWVAASLKFLIPFSLLFAIGSHMEWRTAPVVAPNVSFVMEHVSQPFTIATASPTNVSAPVAFNPFPGILWTVWACGFIAIAISWWVRWRRIMNAVRAGSTVQLDLPIKAISSPSFLEPGVFGVFQPVLLLPEGIFDHLTSEQWKSIVAHELCHVRHRDNLIAMVQMFVETVFWFHPMVWWIGKRIFEERERACDEEVLLSGGEPRTYAQAILKVCELFLKSPLECVAGVSGANLKKRIEAIVNNRVGERLVARKKLLLTAAGVFAVVVPVVVGVIGAPSVRAQSERLAKAPKFEVASIRPSKDCDGNGISSPGTFSECGPLEMFIHMAYFSFANGRRNPETLIRITRGPSWGRSDFFQINAKADGNPSQGMIYGPMLQALLEDRFSLNVHRETEELPGYTLTVDKRGPKLKPFKEGSCIPEAPVFSPDRMLAPGQKACREMPGMKGANATWEMQGTNLERFSLMVGGLFLGRPVIDKTGITGLFDFYLEFAPDENTPAFPPGEIDRATADLRGPSILDAFEEQLGLKLVPTKIAHPILVIDHVERPSEN